MTPRRSISRTMRNRIMERHDWKCAECGAIDGPFDLDHDIALAAGGRDEEDNLRPLCRERCHREKTKTDAKVIAKTRRQSNMRLDAEPKPRKWKRKFQTGLTRKLNGQVVANTGRAKMR